MALPKSSSDFAHAGQIFGGQEGKVGGKRSLISRKTECKTDLRKHVFRSTDLALRVSGRGPRA
eukprot:1340952-Rhodomonas_salina.1